MENLSVYLPPDRRAALAAAAGLPERAHGAAMFADVTGFTPLAEALARALGPRQGAEELTALLNRVYSALIAEVERFGGSVVVFSGDAITCWFDDALPTAAQPGAVRALAAALAMRQAMGEFSAIAVAGSIAAALLVKIAVAAGPIRRFLIGDPRIQVIEVLAGSTLERLGATAHLAQRDEVLLDTVTLAELAAPLLVTDWRIDAETQQRAAVVARLPYEVEPTPWPALPAGELSDEQLRPWVPLAVYARVRQGADPLLAELRPAVALMLQLDGLDYDGDALAVAQLDAYMRRVQAIVTRYEGHLVDLTMADKGGYLFVAFGALHAHEDDARRAALAALELRALRLTPTSAPPRIGISRGTMRTGPYGGATRHTYGVLGDEVNLACRLMSAALPGQILVSAQLQRALDSSIQALELPALRVKGKRDPVAVFQVLAEAPVRPVIAERASAATPLIGRTAEYSLLAGAVSALAAGASGLVIIDGEAGIGKSRLLAELAGLLRDRGIGALSGAGQRIEQTAYAAWRAIFQSLFGLERELAPAERTAQMQAQLAQIAPELLDRLPLLSELVGLDLDDTAYTRALDAAERAEQQAALLARLLSARAAQSPLTIVLDDAHLLDSQSLSLVVRTAQACSVPGDSAATAPQLLFVLALRTLDAQHPAMPQFAQLLGLRGARRISLSALSASQITDLAAARLGVARSALPAEIGALVAARAGGNPLFAEELIAALLAAGVIQLEQALGGGRCVVHGDLQQVMAALPDTLQGLILGRIDRLRPAERLTLKVAAVIGPVFEFRLLRDTRAHQAALAEPALKNQLRALAAQDFIWLEAPEPNLAYRFKHVLTQEAAYQSLLYAQRRAIHGQIAGWYEQTFGSPRLPAEAQPRDGERGVQDSRLAPYIPLLAYHYRQAEDREREQRYVALLGEQTLHAGAFQEALGCFERALALTPPSDSRQRCWLAAQLGRAALLLGHAAEAELHYQQSLELAVAAGDRLGEARACFELGALAYQHKQYAAARQLLERCLAQYRAAGDRRGEVRALDRLGGILIELGEDVQALAYYQQALALGQIRRERAG